MVGCGLGDLYGFAFSVEIVILGWWVGEVEALGGRGLGGWEGIGVEERKGGGVGFG